MPYRLSVESDSQPCYDPLVEDIAMPIASLLDQLEKRGVSCGAEAIGPFTLNRAGVDEQITFRIERSDD